MMDFADRQNEPAPLGAQVNDLPLATLADLPENLRLGAAKAGWTELMPVQSKAIPYLFAQRDMMIQSRTGSGKTGAYLLPLLEMLNSRQRATQAVVLAPTRELAQQVAKEAEILGAATGVRSTAVYGGVGYGEQLAAFKEGAHLVIGTPGRVLDHLLRRSLTLDKLKFLIFDEADRMLSMGFYPDMRRVQAYLPESPVSTFMFSATFPPQVVRLAAQFMHAPGFLNLSSDHIHVTEVEHVFYSVPGMERDRALVRILEIENPAEALIFCNTKQRVEYVSVVLQRFGFDADQITSDLTQAARDRVMERIRQSSLRFLVATDVAARGIDLPELSHVIQYEPPEDPESYIHRAGRTGRAGAGGTAVSLVSPVERPALLRIGQRFGIQLQERPLPSEEEVAQVVAERAVVLLETRQRERDKLQTERMQRFLPLAQTLSQDEDISLLAMLLDDFYASSFHPLPEGVGLPETPARLHSGGRKERSRRSGRKRGR